MCCEIGDIVLVDNYKHRDGTDGKYHNFVIVDIEGDEFNLVPIEYMGFLISSNTDKNNNENPNYPYNEPIKSDNVNGLPKDSHVKCDYQIKIGKDNIKNEIRNSYARTV